jgi:hypothetical protein
MSDTHSGRTRIAVLCAVLGSAAAFSGPADPFLAPPQSVRVEELVRQLGDPEFAAREAATRELMKHPEAFPAVREASRSSDAEIARRAEVILREFNRLEAVRSLPRIKAHIRDQEPDLFVERVMRYGGNEDHVWQALTDFGKATCALGPPYTVLVGGRFGKRKESALAFLENLDVAQEKKVHGLRALASDTRTVTDIGYYLYRGDSLTVGTRADLILAVMEGPLRGTQLGGMLFVNGGVSVVNGPPRLLGLPRDRTLKGVVVCDGDIDFPVPAPGIVLNLDEIAGAVLVCNGSVKCPKTVGASVILAAGNVYFPEGAGINRVKVVAGGKIHLPKKYELQDSKLIENVPDPTAPFKFFDLSRVGLEVKAADGGVRVAKAEDKKPFAAAGVRKGDVVAAVDGKKVESVAGFRKQIRTAFVQGDCTLTVRRGAETKEIAVRFPD